MTMNFKTKRRFSFAVIAIFMFFDGIEYAVVFPTLWENLQHLGISSSEVYYLGLCISAITVTDMIMGLFIGRILDVVFCTGRILFVLNLFNIVASLMYLGAQSPRWILISRLIAGFGNVASVVLITDVSRSTSLEERTRVLISFNIAQQIGLLFGPACNLFLRKIHFKIFGDFQVDKLNAPGLFLGSVYILFAILVLFCYYDLAYEKKKEEEEEEEQQADTSYGTFGQAQDQLPPTHNQSEGATVTWRNYKEEIFRGEIIALLFLRFIALFGQTCLEAIVTPMMKIYFNYGDFENSVLYLLGGTELVFVSIGIAYISTKVSDRSFIMFGVVLHLITLIWFTAFVPRYERGNRSNLGTFAVGTVLDLASVSIILDIGLSLSTKLVTDEVQGFTTGVRRFFMNLAMLLGPLWGGGTLHWLTSLFVVPLVMLIVAAAMYVDSYAQLIPRCRDSSNTNQQIEAGSEDLAAPLVRPASPSSPE